MAYEIDIRKNPTYLPDNPVTDADFNSRNSNYRQPASPRRKRLLPRSSRQ